MNSVMMKLPAKPEGCAISPIRNAVHIRRKSGDQAGGVRILSDEIVHDLLQHNAVLDADVFPRCKQKLTVRVPACKYG